MLPATVRGASLDTRAASLTATSRRSAPPKPRPEAGACLTRRLERGAVSIDRADLASEPEAATGVEVRIWNVDPVRAHALRELHKLLLELRSAGLRFSRGNAFVKYCWQAWRAELICACE